MAWRRSLLFEGLDRDEADYVIDLMDRRAVRAGAAIFEEGEVGDTLYLIEEGRVEIAKHVADETEKVLAVLGPGDFFGEMVLVEDRTRSARASAVGAAVIHGLSSGTFDRIVDERPRAAFVIERNIARTICRRLRQTNAQIAELVLWGLQQG